MNHFDIFCRKNILDNSQRVLKVSRANEENNTKQNEPNKMSCWSKLIYKICQSEQKKSPYITFFLNRLSRSVPSYLLLFQFLFICLQSSTIVCAFVLRNMISNYVYFSVSGLLKHKIMSKY